MEYIEIVKITGELWGIVEDCRGLLARRVSTRSFGKCLAASAAPRPAAPM